MSRSAIKAKTSVTLSVPLLVKIDELIGAGVSRSAFIEEVLQDHIREQARRAVYERDLQILNESADYFNREMEEVLRYQAPVDSSETE
jgi:metal-responsive CopG/Arc/MetJ family transcriptional regulator